MEKTLNLIKNKIKRKGWRKTLGYILLGFLWPVYRKIWLETILGSYSQKGEDLIIDSLLKYKKRGFYVDVGANHPDEINNTKRFYRKWWHGINIEPNPVLFRKLQTIRKRDLNLNIGVSDKKRGAQLYMMDANTLSTCSKKQADLYVQMGYHLVKKIAIQTLPLATIFSRYTRRQNIDFLSIDTEGFDVSVLKSNDWKKYRPTVICVESSTNDNNKSRRLEIDFLLKSKNYRKVAETEHFGEPLNAIYKRC